MPGHTPGHTPGSTIYVMSDGESARCCSATWCTRSVELHERDWEAVFDVDPVAARAMRNAIADEALNTPDLVMGAHFPGCASAG